MAMANQALGKCYDPRTPEEHSISVFFALPVPQQFFIASVDYPNAMPEEIEIKLTVPPDALSRVARLPWIRASSGGSVKHQKLVSVYFDTARFSLRDHHISLRVRRAGRLRLQTIKSDANGRAGAFGRTEWEQEIADDVPDLSVVEKTALAPLTRRKLERNLQPVFETEVWRTTVPLHVGDSDLELAIDRGHIRAGERNEPISEIEIELKQGDAAEVSRIAGRLAKMLSTAYEPLSKPERGYALREGRAGGAVHAARVVIARELSTGESFKLIGLSCLNHMAANGCAVRRGDGSGIHQMRVGLRRLRAAVSVFRELLRDSQTEKITAELKWLTEQLGPARELDVFVKESIASLAEARPDVSEIAELRRDFEQRRKVGFANAKAAVATERYRRLVLDVALWLAHGDWSTSSDAWHEARRQRPVLGFATTVLSARARKVIKRLRKLNKLGPHDRHKLRIDVKKLRYATEFFSTLFDGPKVRTRQRQCAKSLKDLQDALGKLNDISVHQRIAREIIGARKRADDLPQKAYALGLVMERERRQAASCIAAAMKAGRRLARLRPFWT
jgi:inorganic triphosphatase YgiF